MTEQKPTIFRANLDRIYKIYRMFFDKNIKNLVNPVNPVYSTVKCGTTV
jgi:hypothetical protein